MNSMMRCVVVISRMPAIVLLIAVLASGATALAQSKQPQGGGAQSSPPGPQSVGLQGLSYAKDQWPEKLSHPPKDDNVVVLCFKMEYALSGVQPFVLEPVAKIDGVTCSQLDEKHPLEMDQLLVVAIDAQKIDIGQLRVLNINATDAQGVSINPTPVRPSFGGTTAGLNLEGKKVYFLTWLNRLPGDAIRTISINVIYSPAAPGAPWATNIFYPVGSVVSTPATKDQPAYYYVAANSGVSAPTSDGGPQPPAAIGDLPVQWRYLGATLPSGMTSAGVWTANYNYTFGQVIVASDNLAYFECVKPGKTGSNQPSLVVPASLPEAPISHPTTRDDSAPGGKSLLWKALGTRNPNCTRDNMQWRPSTDYANKAVVCDPLDGAEYQALQAGTSGPTQPNFRRAAPIPLPHPITWTIVGTVPPASVTGSAVSDVMVNLLTLQLPQSHSRSYYNLSTGVVFSTVRKPTIGVPPGLMGSMNTSDQQIMTSNNRTVDPVLLLTFYPWPIDAETHCGWECIAKTAPGISLGFSLSSPSSSFYLGASFELFRNMQVAAGGNLALVAEKPSPSVAIASNATTATTAQRFEAGFFVGLTFNVSGFVQGIFGGGGSKSPGQ